MKKLLLIFLSIGMITSAYSQVEQPQIKNIADLKGTIIKKEKGEYTDSKTKRTLGTFSLLYIIDTIHHHLLHVTLTNQQGKGEFTYMFNYTENKLTQASSGVIDKGIVRIYKNYAFEEEDYRLSEKDLQALSETEEKFALLKESKSYLIILKKL
jgi:hypothetical protein